MSNQMHFEPAAADLGILLKAARDLRGAFRRKGIARALSELPWYDLEAFMSDLCELFRALDNSVSTPDLDPIAGGGDGPIGQLNQQLARMYGAPVAYFGEGGSSLNNVKLCLALKQVIGRSRKPVCLADNVSHLSMASGLIYADLEVEWLRRRYLQEWDLLVPISVDQVAEALGANPDIGAVCLTMPTYDGLVSDIRGIAKVCHAQGALLVVDGAWGALHGVFSDDLGFPPSAIEAGADAVVISLHKVGLGLSQASATFFNNLALAGAYFDIARHGLSTTSPLYLIPAVAQMDIERLDSERGRSEWASAIAAADQFKREAARIGGITPIEPGLVAERVGSRLWGDPHHVLLHTGAAGITGYRILDELQKRFAIDIEKATPRTCLLLFGPEHPGWVDDLGAKLRAIVKNLRSSKPLADLGQPYAISGRGRLRPGQAFFRERTLVRPEMAIGRIAARIVAAYPPGAAVIAPGMEISADAVDFVRMVHDSGGRLIGLSADLDAPCISVLAE